MKVMTWNIWGGKHLEEVIRLIQTENPDVIGLQEVKTIDGVNHAETIATKLGYEVVYCKSFTTNRHIPHYDIGNAVLTKLPIIKSTCHFLSSMEEYEDSSKTEPRTAVEVILDNEGKGIQFITTHLGYSDNFGESEIRLKQLENLLSIIDKKDCILVGDFNSLPSSIVVRKIEERLKNADTDKTETSYTDMKDPNHKQDRIDYIFMDLLLPMKNFRIIKTDASDHKPLCVEI